MKILTFFSRIPTCFENFICRMIQGIPTCRKEENCYLSQRMLTCRTELLYLSENSGRAEAKGLYPLIRLSQPEPIRTNTTRKRVLP